ncbi:putative quinol monooxygenase [Pollutimonas sp. M17]|uniref:putative quinol monooxygenase n=1 Tax=Pollutimonas sp. M17 TaxID=2962065 RepID=UPI0021F4E4D6|nr:putative quinol monooxygenase [Pollutimonas sp. M17]UYO92778.1 antibiotic biosynthesis monooxygenase [Pollutimonas sp. M17]
MTKNPSQQLVLLVEFRIRPAHIEAFESAILRNAAASLTDEAGCRRFDVCRDPDDPALFFLYEIYDDQAAIDTHLRSPHYLAFDALSRDWVEKKAVRKMVLRAADAPIS